MTNETPDYSIFEKYQFGALAARLNASKESAKYAPSSLEVLAGSKGLNLGDEAMGFIRGTQASQEGIKTAINTYAEQFEQARADYTPSDLSDWYMPLLDGIEDEEKERILGVLNEYSEKLGEINKKFKVASKIIENSEDADLRDLYNEEQISQAREDVEKYGKVMLTMQILDNYKFEGLRPDVIDAARTKELKGLASRL